jgi:hypothetical protein
VLRIYRGRVLVPLVTGALAVVPLLAGAASPARAAVTIPTPPVTAGLQLRYVGDWFSTSAGNVYLSGNDSAVARWGDLSGNGRDLTSATVGGIGTASPHPGFGLNGHRTIRFDGLSGLMKTYGSAFSLPQPTTFFIVSHSFDAPSAAPAFVFDSTDSSAREVFGSPAANQTALYANLDLRTPSPAPAGFHVWSGTFNGANSALYRDGVLVASGDTGASPLTGFTLGGLSSNGTYGYNFSSFDVAEVLVYSGALSAADRSSVSTWLNTTYAASTTTGTPPTNTTLPSISASYAPAKPTIGNALNQNTGTWSGSTPSFAIWQFLRCDATGGACTNYGPIHRSDQQLTTTPPLIATADVGYTFRVAVTDYNAYGSASATSAPTAVVVAPGDGTAPVLSAYPSLDGVFRVGETLSTNNGAWSSSTPITYTYQWSRCTPTCAAISTAPTYTLTAADVGARVQITVKATNSFDWRTASTQSTIPVLAASGSAGSVPIATGLQAWFDADTETYADGAAVTKWTDKSSFHRDLTVGDPSQAPTYRRSAANGRATLDFDGVRSLLKTYGSTFTLAQPDTVFVVYRSLDADSSNRAFVLDSNNGAARQAFGRGGSGDVRMYANNELTAGGIVYPNPTLQVVSLTFNGTSSEMWRNGVKVAGGSAGTSALGGLTVGGLSTSGTYGYDLSHAQIAEIIVYQGGSFTGDDSNRKTVTDWLLAKYDPFLPVATATAPANTAAPTINGAATDGTTLTATAGSWTGTDPIATSLQWQRCTSTTSCTPIDGATAAAYTIEGNDIGFSIAVRATATNSVGTASAASTTTAVVTAAAPSNTQAPTVSGYAHQGDTLTASTGTWTGSQPLAYTVSWQRCDSGGGNCTTVGSGSAYTATAADIGSTLRTSVAAGNSVGSATASSTPTGTVTDLATPPVAGGLQLWFRADDVAGTDGTPVTRWADKSGNGRDLSAADPSQAPAYRTNAVNGHAAIEFDGVRSLLKTYDSSFTLAQPDTFFIVYRSLDTGESYVFDSTDSSTRQILGRAADGNAVAYANIGLETAAIYPFAGYQIWSGTFNGAASTLWRNSVSVGQGSAGGSALNGFTVGALNSAGQWGYNYSHALVAEILFYNGSLSDTDRAAITTWLNQRYGAY